MASEVDICNLALSHLGDNANVASLNPPEGSAQAEHCARFYPMARDSLLELHAWSFATKRVVLAQLSNGWSQWAFAYALPNDALNTLAVLAPDASSDYMPDALGLYTPQPYSCEINELGTEVIYTDQANAVLRYTARIEDPTKFSPLFVHTLSWHLAGMLAGPVLKGDVGAAEAKRCAAMAQTWLVKAKESDASQRHSTPQHSVGWIAGR
jgi:hypothetical protein